MQKLLTLFLAVVLLASCSNNNTATKETKDTAAKDTGTHVQPNGNTVTPPASNGQY